MVVCLCPVDGVKVTSFIFCGRVLREAGLLTGEMGGGTQMQQEGQPSRGKWNVRGIFSEKE